MNKNFAPMNIAGVFDRVMDVYTKSFGKQMAFSAIAGICTSIVFSMAGAIAAIVIAMLFVVLPGSGTVIFSTGIVIVLFTLWFALFNAGSVLLSKTAFYGDKIKLPINKLPKAMLRVCTAFLAQILVFLPVTIGGGFLFSRIANRINWWNIRFTPSLVITFIIISLLVFIVYLMLENIFAVTVAVAAFEERWFFGAVVRSFELIRYDFWKILAARFLWLISIFFIFYAAFGVFSLVILLGYWLMDTFGSSAMDTLELVAIGVFSITSIIIAFAALPLNGIIQSVIYYNQRIKYEGLDIEVMIEAAERDLEEEKLKNKTIEKLLVETESQANFRWPE